MHQRKILLLENVATQAAGARESLSQAGFQVAVSRYETDGLKRLVEWSPDLVLVSTSHPAGDFVDYCRRVRALVPSVRLVVTSPLTRERLFQEHPGLQAAVDGVLPRPYNPGEIAALLASPPSARERAEDAPAAPAASETGADPDAAELRAEFQRQLDARFLEVEELKRHLEVAMKRAASGPGLEWLQSENDHLRQGIEETKKKTALALATEQLKRSEIEVKLDNLLRMKEDFEFRAQNELEEAAGEIAQLRAQLQEVLGRTDTAAQEHAALSAEMERALIEKEQIEERLHSLEAGGAAQSAAAPTPGVPAADAARVEELERQASQLRAEAAEAQVALAEAAAKEAVAEEARAGEAAARREMDRIAAGAAADREQAAGATRELAAAAERSASLEKNLEQARQALAAAGERGAALEKELAAAREARAADAAATKVLRERLEAAESAATAAKNSIAAESERRGSLEKTLAEAQQGRAEDARLAEERHHELAARLTASEAARLSVASEAEALVEQVSGQGAALAADLERERAARADLERRLNEAGALLEAAERRAAEADALRARAETLGAEIERLGASHASALADVAGQGAGLLEQALAESGSRERERAAECVRLAGRLADRERELAQEAGAWRHKAQAAGQEVQRLQARASETDVLLNEARRAAAEREERFGKDLAARELGVTALREELAAAGEAHRRETARLEVRAGERESAMRDAAARLESAAATLAATRREFEDREIEMRLQLESARAASRELEARLAERPAPQVVTVPGPGPGQSELRRIQELLEEVIARARTEAVEYARRDAELSVRLQAALDERRLLQERFDRASAEATERERRSSSLLQSAIDHVPTLVAERANLPAVVPAEPVAAPAAPAAVPPGAGPILRRRPVLVALAVLAVLAIAGLLAFFGLRRPAPAPAVKAPAPAATRPHAAAGPASQREVWDRWTRSDSSGGVLVQATLRGEEALRAEVEADRARGASDEQVRAELARRLAAFRFDTTHYVTVYLKNLAPGYPAYFDDLPGHFRLRDGAGNEVPAAVPPGHERERRIFSFGAGPPGELIYEASVSLGFDRARLSPSAGYLQLVVSDVGGSSRRVLTWELE